MENIPFLLTDTVGFIRKLPTMLIESFKSTLDEVREADILVHVVDISHPSYEEHLEVVNNTLVEIGAADKPTILVFNKIDLIQTSSYKQKNGMMKKYSSGRSFYGKRFGSVEKKLLAAQSRSGCIYFCGEKRKYGRAAQYIICSGKRKTLLDLSKLA